ncbi:GSCOCT00001047001.3-RA-CDS [Cotesia congregata]|uniref:Gustatory receptor n=1 Tax=Cotesia congregata TaxID=51543 RepID=A0A8J2HGW4_COTCN|nr:GSCOCT00001047001.3-RA-CDS [Cotesia congregata]CAG5096027.1 gustatory receptor 6 [Cotesia congregata]
MHISSKIILKLLFYYFKILGFMPYVYYKPGILKRSISATIYTVILTLGYSKNVMNVMLSRSSFIRPRETILAVIVDFVSLMLDYIAISMIWIYSITRFNQVQDILKLFLKTLESTSVIMKIKMTKIYDDILREMFVFVLFLNILFIITVTTDLIVCYGEIKDYDFPVWTLFNYPRIIPLNYAMIHIYFIKILGRHFCLLNKNIGYLPEVYVDEDSSMEIIKIRLKPREIDEKLREFDKLDLELRNQIKMSNEIFALPFITVLLLQFTHSIFNSYLFMNSIMKKTFSWPILINVSWVLMRMLLLLSFIDNCHTVCEEANKKVKILHESWALKRLDGFKEMLKSISLHQLQEPVEIKFHDALKLNHELFYKMAGVTTTYLIIMIQLDQQVQNRHNHQI